MTAFEGGNWPATPAGGKISGAVVTAIVLLTVVVSLYDTFRPRRRNVAGEIRDERELPWKQ